jgi:hypothetical protein
VHAGEVHKIAKYVARRLDPIRLDPIATTVINHPPPEDSDWQIVFIFAGNLTSLAAYTDVGSYIKT